MRSLSVRPAATRLVPVGLELACGWAEECWVLVLLYIEGLFAV